MTTYGTAPTGPPGEQIRQAVRDRPSSDYIFHFWTALGWTILTFGLYWFYAFYQLMKRSRDHNRRRATLLQAAHDLAWARAVQRGSAESLRPAFESVRNDVVPLRTLGDDLFRDPLLWVLLSVVGNGLVWVAGAILLDQDLLRHQRHDKAAQSGLTSLFAELGAALPPTASRTKQPHNYVGRVLAVVFTLGLYSLWWVADLMRDGNLDFEQAWAWEDALVQSLGDTTPIAA